MTKKLKDKKKALYNSINRRQVKKELDNTKQHITVPTFAFAITLSVFIGAGITVSYYTGQPLPETLTTVSVDGKTITIGSNNHSRLNENIVGRGLLGGNMMWIEAYRGARQMEETCNHELLHLYGVPGGDTTEHKAIEAIDDHMDTRFCNKVLQKANQKTEENIVAYRP
jgi:hypothetical protein